MSFSEFKKSQKEFLEFFKQLEKEWKEEAKATQIKLQQSHDQKINELQEFFRAKRESLEKSFQELQKEKSGCASSDELSEQITKFRSLIYILREIKETENEIEIAKYNSYKGPVKYLNQLEEIKNDLFEKLEIDDVVIPQYLEEQYQFSRDLADFDNW